MPFLRGDIAIASSSASAPGLLPTDDDSPWALRSAPILGSPTSKRRPSSVTSTSDFLTIRGRLLPICKAESAV